MDYGCRYLPTAQPRMGSSYERCSMYRFRLNHRDYNRSSTSRTLQSVRPTLELRLSLSSLREGSGTAIICKAVWSGLTEAPGPYRSGKSQAGVWHRQLHYPTSEDDARVSKVRMTVTRTDVRCQIGALSGVVKENWDERGACRNLATVKSWSTKW